eukprot:m.43068 g.43068  ORF g.43068 m.43068 type:complete len:652 (+) comp19294_c0_seq1:247-2202(+)
MLTSMENETQLAEQRRQAEKDAVDAWEKKMAVPLSPSTVRAITPHNNSSSSGPVSVEEAEIKRQTEKRLTEEWEAHMSKNDFKKIDKATDGHGHASQFQPLKQDKPSIAQKPRLRERSKTIQTHTVPQSRAAARASTPSSANQFNNILSRSSKKPFNTLQRSRTVNAARFSHTTSNPIQSAMADFMDAENLEQILSSFDRTCSLAGVERDTGEQFFEVFKRKVAPQVDFKRGHFLRVITKKLKTFWEVEELKACDKVNCVVVGAGPVGLRAAIEMALLRANVTILEMRTDYSRYNILHLWDWVCNDLLQLGCNGAEILGKSFFHIGTSKLQIVLTKVALCLGVRIFSGAKFVGTTPSTSPTQSWTVDVELAEAGHNALCTTHLEANVLLGAGGRAGPVLHHCHFEQKRTKLATNLAIVAHFKTNPEDRKMEEFSHSAQFQLSMFKELKRRGLHLENVVYYQGDTHYYVMTPTPKCLKQFGVINTIEKNPLDTVAPPNVNREKLRAFARQVAEFFGLPESAEFLNDSMSACAIFDFSTRSSCKVPAQVLGDSTNKQLAVQIIGDALIEPFWPEGLGVNRGFLGALDCVYNIQEWFHEGRSSSENTKKMLRDRDKLFQIQKCLSAHTKTSTLRDNVRTFNVSPVSRYLKWKTG